jgi:hypothetical protein
MIKGKTPEEIRKLFNIVNDFTPEEEVCFITFWGSNSVLKTASFVDRPRSRRRTYVVISNPLVPC